MHLDQDVAWEEPPRGDDFLAAAHLHDILGRNQHFADVLLKFVRLDTLRERLCDLLLEARIGVDDVPTLGGDVGHAAPKRLRIHCTALFIP